MRLGKAEARGTVLPSFYFARQGHYKIKFLKERRFQHPELGRIFQERTVDDLTLTFHGRPVKHHRGLARSCK